MVEIVYRVVAKEGQAAALKELIEDTLITEANKMPACKLFSLFQNTTDPREFIMHEKWDNEASVHEYKQHLIKLLGDPRSGEEFPEVLNRLIAEDEDLV